MAPNGKDANPGTKAAPMREIQDSGIKWGFGTDAFEVNQFRPFQTLYFAVTGKMVGGTVVNTHTVTREEALIAHTKNNAYLLFRENDLGSIQAGRFADMVVTDKDYLTVPADQIKDITSVMTIVGGRVVYDAANDRPTATRLTAERAFAARLHGSCHSPIAAHAALDAGTLRLSAFIGAPDGREAYRDHIAGPQERATELGLALAGRMLEAGAAELLERLRRAADAAT